MHVAFCILDEGGLKEEVRAEKEVDSFPRIVKLSAVKLLVEDIYLP